MTQPNTARRGKTYQDLVAEAKSRIREITADELRQWQVDSRDFVLIDVREGAEHQRGMIEGAVPISRGILEIEIDDAVPNQDKTVVLYCGGGSRSALAADTMREMGYENVYSLIGGYRGWNS